MIDAFEEEYIELELKEIGLRKRLLEIRREQTQNIKPSRPEAIIEVDDGKEPSTYLHYSDYSKVNIPRICKICPDGTIYIKGKHDAPILTRKYTMKSLLWLKQQLPKMVKMQRKTNVWEYLAEKYSKRFTKISSTTVSSLCYLVDSGSCDPWFDEWHTMKNDVQTRL